jgi:hypothetical protein
MRVISARYPKVVIIRDGRKSQLNVGVRWVIRKQESEGPYVKDGERVYGLRGLFF